ncbi:hypothetical protein D3C72_2054420 [compost metagenome]
MAWLVHVGGQRQTQRRRQQTLLQMGRAADMDRLVLLIEDIDRPGCGQSRPRQGFQRPSHQAAEQVGDRRQPLLMVERRRRHPPVFS